jgi:hypothetical protein
MLKRDIAPLRCKRSSHHNGSPARTDCLILMAFQTYTKKEFFVQGIAFWNCRNHCVDQDVIGFRWHPKWDDDNIEMLFTKGLGSRM